MIKPTGCRGKRRDMSFCSSFHEALLGLTGAYWLDDPPDLACQDSTREYPLDGWPLSCKQQVGGSSPPPAPRTAGSEGGDQFGWCLLTWVWQNDVSRYDGLAEQRGPHGEQAH